MQEPTIPLRITRIEPLAPGVAAFYLQPEMGAISYEAGQFLNFVFPTHAGDVRRAYSIAESPLSGAPLRIIVRRIANGIASRWLVDSVRVGDTLYTLPAKGLFNIPLNVSAYGQVLFFAAGIGITPVFSLLKTLLLMPGAPPAALIYSSRSPEEAVLRDELTALQAAHPGRLSIEWLYSNARHAQRARLSSVLMPELLTEYATAPLPRTLCYVCGPSGYMWMVNTLLHQYGVLLFNIRKEIFEPALPPGLPLPPDTGTHEVMITTGSEAHTVTVAYPHSILDAALAQGLALPYSCKAGQCGSCVARCRQGKVWHAYNEVLTDADLARGLVLTCTGHPVEAGVVLDTAARTF